MGAEPREANDPDEAGEPASSDSPASSVHRAAPETSPSDEAAPEAAAQSVESADAAATPPASPPRHSDSASRDANPSAHDGAAAQSFGLRDALLAAFGVAGAIGSAVIAPIWALFVTLAVFFAVLAIFVRSRRRILVWLAVGAALIGGGLGIRAATRDGQRAVKPPPPSQDKVLDRTRRLESRIDQLLQHQVSSKNKEIPLVDLIPIRAAMLEYVNRLRDRRGLVAVRRSPALERLAQTHVADMLATGRFSHEISKDDSFGERLGPAWRGTGEVLAWTTSGDVKNGDPGDSWREVIEFWLDSAPHREILLSPTSEFAGVGVDVGRFEGTRAAVYTVDFGTPKG